MVRYTTQTGADGKERIRAHLVFNTKIENKLRLRERARKQAQNNPGLAIAWQKNNPERYKEIRLRHRHKRRARLKNVEFDGTISLKVLYIRDDGVCQICDQACSREDASIDHIVPIARGGAHTWDNVQLAHLLCNIRKGTK